MGTTDLLLRRLEKELRLTARERIAKGQIPRDAGRSCALCDKPMQSDEIEYEVRPVEAAVQTLRFSQSLPLRMAA
jgi:hypothetical protein